MFSRFGKVLCCSANKHRLKNRARENPKHSESMVHGLMKKSKRFSDYFMIAINKEKLEDEEFEKSEEEQ